MIIEKMRKRNGNLPTTTTSTAVLDALKALGAKRMSLATPYSEELVKLQELFLEGSGVEVLHKTWIKEKTVADSELSPDEVYRLAAEANVPESEAIYISCVNMHAIELIERLEEEFDKPVITSNQATMWRLLRLSHIRDEIKGYGRLFQM